MGFRKRNAKRSDNRSSAKVIMGKPASQLSKEEKKILSARMAEIRSENGGKNTVQNTIPFLCMYQDGVCQVSENFFSLTVQFFDANYSISEFEEQNNIFSKYCDVINLFDNTIKFQLTFENQNRSKAKLVKTVQIPEQEDDFNAIRKEYSEMLTDKLLKGSNGQSARKFLTFGIESTSYKAARAKLMSIKNDVIKGFKAFGVEAELLDGRQRLEALYYALNPYRNSPFLFDWGEMLRAGMDTKDFICPPSLKFNKSDFEIGNAYGAVWGMNILAGELPDEILKDFLEMQNLFCVNIHVEPLDQIDALKFVKKKLTNVEQMKIDEQKKASQSGYDPDILPPAIKMYIEDIEKLLGDLNSKNERLFHISISLRAYAKSKKDLKLLSEMLKRTCQKNNCTMFPYDYRQEQTLVSTLPLCYNEIPVRREMHTSGIAIFVPFTTKELFQDGQATYYGINTLSGNMIRANRSRLKNPNGLILGTPGAGKSFSVKREILDCFLTTVDDIIICDPEGEYFALVAALHGQVVKLATNSKDYLNPMDIQLSHKGDKEALKLKSDFIITLCDLIAGGKDGLENDEKGIIDECIRHIYDKYFENPVPENMPLLEDLYDALLAHKNPKAERIANSLVLYVHGSQNYFNHHTNVDSGNRIMCFDIRDLGNQLKELGMLIVQDAVWNRVSQNRERKIATRYYCDEFHLLLKEKQTAIYSVEIWKRFRKWGGIPTGLTQNVGDFLRSEEIEGILGNSDFVYLLNQNAKDQAILADKLGLSDKQLSYVTNSEPGSGLILFDNVVIPFVDKYPTDTKTYRIMNTKPEESV